jgi:hypothetical protein
MDQTKIPRKTPGQLYSSISVESRDFSENDNKLSKKIENAYVLFCKNINNRFPGLGKGSKYDEKLQNSVDFLKWDLKPEEYFAAYKFTLFTGVLLTGIIILLAYSFVLPKMTALFGSSTLPLLITFGVPLGLFIYCLDYFKNYPQRKVNLEKIYALTFVPEILGYMIMSMKLVPNLEKAIEFASSHGHGKIAEDLKTLLWEVKVGIKSSVAEAIDELAYKWGDISQEFKKSLMKIRSSVIEISESKRFQILDQTMEDTLTSIKNKLEDYARSLSQPAMVMFYMGILLPLLLIIILPVGSAFSNSNLARPIYLILIYNIAIPIGCLVFARKVVRERPITYIPPKIPDNHPDIPPKNTIVFKNFKINIFVLMIIVGTILIGSSLFLQNNFGLTKHNLLVNEGYILEDGKVSDAEFMCTTEEISLKVTNPNLKCATERDFWLRPENNTTPYYIIYGVLLAISLLISIYLYGTNIYKRRVQVKSQKMEVEFKDALYVIASRLGENKPIEEALKHTKNFLSKSLIAQDVFAKTLDNIRIMGLTLKASLFDPNYGALKNNPSRLINSAMLLVVDSVQLGVSVAAKTLMSYSMQLRNTDEVSKMLTNLISDITGTLNSMAKFIAPIILGITTALQRIVMSTLNSIASSNIMQDMDGMVSGIKEGINASGMGNLDVSSVSGLGASIDPTNIAQFANSTTFLIIVAIYVIQIVIIIVYFTTMIEQENLILAKVRIAQTLPVATILFIMTTIFANMIF